jgi:hypothetical protein
LYLLPSALFLKLFESKFYHFNAGTMAKLKKTDDEHQLVTDVAKLIEESRQRIAQTVNTTLSILYWEIGKRSDRVTE